mgnify:CR=1 FL=1
MNYRYGLISALLIIGCLLIFSAITLPAAEDESARIMALGGGAVEGIIPDFYTDYRNNPAVLGGREKTTAFYRLVNPDPARLSLYTIDNEWNLYQHYLEYRSPVNAADFFWGRGESKWKFAVSSIWKLSETEESRNRIYYNSEDYRAIMTEEADDIWLLDLTAAYRIDDDISLGVRFGGRGSYNRYKRRWLDYLCYYRYMDGREVIGSVTTRDDGHGEIFRKVSLYLEGGLRADYENGEFSELAFSVSRSANTSYTDGWDFSLRKDYDEFSGTTYLTDQRYGSGIMENLAEGDSWKFGFKGRHRTESGYIVTAAGSYERCVHDGSRFEADTELDYDYVAEDQEELYESLYFKGEGAFDGISGALKVGRKLTLRKELDLYIGFTGFGSHIGWNYDPVTEYKLSSRRDDDYYSERSSDRTEFAVDVNRAVIYLPISLEFKPASFFTYFASAIPFLHAEMTTRKLGMPDSGRYNNINHICNNEVTTRNLWTDYNFNTGFRLNYREKIYIDLYTGSTLFTERLSYLDINIGYNF